MGEGEIVAFAASVYTDGIKRSVRSKLTLKMLLYL